MQPFGVTSWTLGIEDNASMLAHCRKLGFDGVQYCGDTSIELAAELRQVANAEGLQLFAIDPFNCYPPAISDATTTGVIEFYKAIIDFAVAAETPVVTVQGICQWTRNCSEPQQALDRIKKALTELSIYAATANIRLSFECVNRYEQPVIHRAAQLNALLDELNITNVDIVLDAFHMNIEEQDSSRALLTAGDRLGGYHISDSTRGPIGSGRVDFIREFQTLQQLQYQGPIMLELMLPHLVPNKVPHNTVDKAALDKALVASIQLWRQFDEHCCK